MTLTITGQSGSWEVSRLVSTVTFSGDEGQAARSLDFELLAAPEDPSIPKVDCSLGSAVFMEADGVTFAGTIYSRTKNTASPVIQVRCFDRGFALKKIQIAQRFVDTTPEAAAAQLCGEYGIPTGQLAATGVPLTQNFIGTTLYDAIAKLYGLASDQTGKDYHLGFTGEKLEIWELGSRSAGTVLRAGENLLSASTTESVEQMVNSVLLCDQNGEILGQVQDEEAAQLYGLMQQVVTGEEGETQAQGILRKQSLSQKISVQCLGGAAFRTGYTIQVQEPYTGLVGRFFITSDTHTWKNGIYQNKLVLAYDMGGIGG